MLIDYYMQYVFNYNNGVMLFVWCNNVDMHCFKLNLNYDNGRLGISTYNYMT